MEALDDLRTRFRMVGAALTVVSMLLTAAFGWSLGSNVVMSALLAFGLSCATFGSAYIWPFIVDAFGRKAWGTFALLVPFGLLFTGTDLTTNFGTMSWQQTSDIERATADNVKYDDGRAKIEDNRANLAMWRKRLDDLKAAKPWVAEVTATGMRDQLPAMDEAIRQETKRGGCGPKCLALTKERASVAERIADAETRDDLASKIEATQRVVDAARADAKKAQRSESAALLQNTSLASVFTLSLSPSEAAQHWTAKGVAWIVAGFFALGAMGCNIVGWGASKAQGSRERLEAFLDNVNRHGRHLGVPEFKAA